MTAPFSDLDERALKTMTGQLVSACGGTRAVSILLATAGKPFSEARVSGYCTISDMDRFMPVRQVTKLELAVGQPVVSRWMAERIVREPCGGAVCAKDLIRIVRETSDLNGVLGDAVDDGVVDALERAEIRQAITDLRRELIALEAKVERP